VRIRIIDAFTDRPFAGNPAAVCLLNADAWPDEGWMRQVAAEMNLSETAFAYPLPEPANADWALRWFTPTVEVDLCGHATEIPVPDGLAEALDAQPDTSYGTGDLGDLLAIFPDEADVRALAPDFTALTHLARRDGIRGVIATAPAAGPGSGYDFVSRFFAPAQGIPEDPVTGSAHTALAPYWSGRLGRDSLTELQASARTGLVRAAIHGDRVHLAGHAITVLDGTLHHIAG